MEQKYYWYSLVCYHNDGHLLMEDAILIHPFEERNNLFEDTSLPFIPTSIIITCWREITKEEYELFNSK